jgi:hypothetical protein
VLILVSESDELTISVGFDLVDSKFKLSYLSLFSIDLDALVLVRPF